jgi:purine-binding chemotaxis protein CheW
MSTGGITVGVDVTCVAEVCPVRSVSRLLTVTPGLVGAIDLRGHPIPLFDPLSLAGLDPRASEPRIAVVAIREGRRIALAFDAIEGLVQVPQDKVDRQNDGAFFAGTLEIAGQIVSVVEPRALLSRPDVPSASVVATGAHSVMSSSQAFLTFDAGGARFGIEAIGVEATVPRQSIQREGLADGAWLGVIRHHGRRVPVMHLNAVLGIGEVRDLQTAEIVVLRFPERRLVGLAVETIRRMHLVSLDSARTVHPMMASRSLGVTRTVPDADSDTYLIDLDTLRADEALCSMASLSDEEVTSSPKTAAAEDATGPRAERERYLVARAGTPVAIPIRQVARIMMPPSRVTPLAHAPDWFPGVFHEDGQTVPLIDLGCRLGHGRIGRSDRARVLLTGDQETLTGYAVEGVDHLEWSAWRSDRMAADGIVGGLVGFPRLGAEGVLNLVNLNRFPAASAVHG